MNPIIYLWAHPRPMSTGRERIMRARGVSGEVFRDGSDGLHEHSRSAVDEH